MSTENLYHEDARKKIAELAEEIDFTMMATDLDQHPIHVIPMSTKKVDEKGNIWFLSSKDSSHNTHINRDNRVQLLYSNPKSREFMTVYGRAVITTDRPILEDLYGKSDDIWFDGADDPKLTAIRVEPAVAYYWDSSTNKLVNLVKMASAMMSGEEADLGEEGELNV